MTEHTVPAEHDLLHALLEHATELTAILNAGGLFRYVSPSYMALLGYAPADLVGTDSRLMVHPDDLDRLQAALAPDLVAANLPATATMRYRHADGSWRTFETTSTNRVSDPVVRGVVLNSRDVTERQRGEEQRAALLAGEQSARATAERANAFLHAVLDVLPVGVAISDATGRLIETNAVARAIWGETPLVGSTAEYGVYRGWWPDSGEPLAAHEWALARALNAGEGSTGEEVLIETFEGTRKVLLNSAAPVRDADGQLSGAVAAMLDITARKQLEQRTHEALTALLQMAEILVEPDGATTTETAGTRIEAIGGRLVVLTRGILGCQRVSITAVDPRTGASRPVAMVGLAPHEEHVWRANRGGASLREYLTTAQLERLAQDSFLVVQAKDVPGQVLPYGVLSLLLVLLRLEQDVVGVLSLDHGSVQHSYPAEEVALARAVARLTALVVERERLLHERAEAEAHVLALQEANRRMDAFLALASHELKTPLTSVGGYIQIAEFRLHATAQSQEAPSGAMLTLLERARRNIVRMNRLVDDLLDMSRIHADQLSLEPQPCDLAQLVRDAIEEQRDLAPARLVELTLPRDPSTVPVLLDPGRIHQVVMNYLLNAVKYTPPDRPIEVGLQVSAGQARVWVRDHGPGLSSEEQERVWTRFYRVPDRPHYMGSQVGLGLGLYISKTLIERQGGHVGVESIPGAGATFWFTVPLAAPDAGLLHDPAPTPRTAERSGGPDAGEGDAQQPRPA